MLSPIARTFKHRMPPVFSHFLHYDLLLFFCFNDYDDATLWKKAKTGLPLSAFSLALVPLKVGCSLLSLAFSMLSSFFLRAYLVLLAQVRIEMLSLAACARAAFTLS